MKNCIDERKVMIHLYELSGRAGTICVPRQIKSNPNILDRNLCTPEYYKAQWLYLTLSDKELQSRLESTPENIIHPCGSVIQWGPYCRMDERAYKREYLKSDEWKRKRDAVMSFAWSICENEGCTNEAKQVHHLNYERIGEEGLEDLQALCPKCHMQKHGISVD